MVLGDLRRRPEPCGATGAPRTFTGPTREDGGLLYLVVAVFGAFAQIVRVRVRV